MKLVLLIAAVILFFVLTPGVLLRLPKKGSIYVVAGVHALVFGALLWLLAKFVLNVNFEGFQEGNKGIQKKTWVDDANAIQKKFTDEFVPKPEGKASVCSACSKLRSEVMDKIGFYVNNIKKAESQEKADEIIETKIIGISNKKSDKKTEDELFNEYKTAIDALKQKK